jgi:hypothetical protein
MAFERHLRQVLFVKKNISYEKERKIGALKFDGQERVT